MYCPKCGAQAIENQRFCKTCGTNLELVSDALEGGEDTLGQLRLDMEALKTTAKNFAKNVNVGVHEYHGNKREKRQQDRDPRTPKPKEWLAYSWQHNLRNGLLSLFGGAGLGVVLYYMGQIMINDGVIQSIEEASGKPIHGLESIARWIWLFALIPILKGLGQIIYAAFFGESIKTLTERFAPPQIQPPPQFDQQHSTAPITSSIPSFEEPPPSVTENTTRMFDHQSQPRQESQ